jgi:dTDP-4-amino-4,6-dideoxygalactose transaminase
MKPFLTHAPLPTMSNLAAALVNPTLSNEELSSPWCRSGDKAFWFARSAWSLLAIAQWRQRLTGHTSINVWLPDFFCNASLVPLRSIGAQLEFYPLTDQMAPDLDACGVMADEKRPDLFVLVHYFGQPTPVDGVTEICIDTGAWLIEDAAHVLRPIPGIGEHGDCVLYSPHKHLPIPDGAALVVREHGPAHLMSQATAMAAFQNVYSFLLNTPGFSHKPAWEWLGKRTLQRLGVRAWWRPITSFLNDVEIINGGQIHPKMSWLARYLLSGQLDTLNDVARLRRQNRLLWKELLTKYNSITAEIFEPYGDFTPYLTIFVFCEEVQAEEAFLRWQRAGLPVTTWPDLPPEVSGQKERHRKAKHMRKSRLYLPLHQTMKPQRIITCGQSVHAGKERNCGII